MPFALRRRAISAAVKIVNRSISFGVKYTYTPYRYRESQQEEG